MLEDVNLVDPMLVFVLVLIPPTGDNNLRLMGRLFIEGHPLVSVLHSVSEGQVGLTELCQVPSRTRGSLLKQPEGQVEVAASQGSVENLVFMNFREEHRTTREAEVVLDELLFPFSVRELHADTWLGAR